VLALLLIISKMVTTFTKLLQPKGEEERKHERNDDGTEK
jgi:hypothetical protein